VRVLLDGSQKAVVKANGSGQWATSLNNVAKGSHTLKAVNFEPSLHYFATAGSPSELHSIDPQTNAIDTAPNFPVTLNGLSPLVISSQTKPIAYAIGYLFQTANVQRVNLETGAVDLVAGYPSVNAGVGSFSQDGSKYFSANNDGTITVIDTTTNTISSTITPAGATNITSVLSVGDDVYATDANTGSVWKIDTKTNTTTPITINCPSGGNANSVQPDDTDPTVFWTGCSTQSIIKMDKATLTVLLTINVGSPVAGISTPLGSNKVFVSDPTNPAIRVYDATTGSLLQTVNTSDIGFAPFTTSDGSKIFFATPGQSFSNGNISVIDTNTYAVTDIATSGPTLLAAPGPDKTAEASVSFTVGSMLANTGINQMYMIIAAGALMLAGFQARRLFVKNQI
jgi:hypothetical protein